MRSLLFWKFFALQLIAALLVLGSAMLVMRVQIASSFSDYLRARLVEQMEPMAEQMAQDVAAGAGLHEALRRAEGAAIGPPGGATLDKRRRPPDEHPRLALTDPDGRPIVPRRRPPGLENGVMVPVVVDGEVVARLWRPAGPSSLWREERRFARRQSRALWITAALTIPLAVLFAAIGAGGLTRPLRRLSVAVAGLARRDFSVRADVLRNDELGRLAQDINRMAESLERHENRQRQWIADIAHELRTPLAILRGEIEALADGVRAPEPERLNSLHDDVLRLGTLVDDLHLLSVAEAGDMPLVLRRIDLVQLARDAVAGLQEVMADEGFDLLLSAPEDPVWLDADPQRLRQLLANLLGNVREHGRPGTVRVGVSGDCAPVLTVCDAGPGVGEQHLPHLFDRLYRADPSRQREHGGSGLGLAICKSIVEAHGGTISASNSGDGLMVTARFGAAS